MSHGPLPAPSTGPKSTLDKKFVANGNPDCDSGPFVGLRFQELSRDDKTVTLKFYNRTITVKLDDYHKWTWINVEE